MVQILRRPDEQNPDVDVTCKKCTAGLRFKKHEGVFMSDPRDGNAYVFQCPCCFQDNWIAESLVDNR